MFPAVTYPSNVFLNTAAKVRPSNGQVNEVTASPGVEFFVPSCVALSLTACLVFDPVAGLEGLWERVPSLP